MHPSIPSIIKKQVTKLTDKARAALEDKSLAGSGLSKNHRKEDLTHTLSVKCSVGSTDKATPNQETSRTTFKCHCIEVEEVDNNDKQSTYNMDMTEIKTTINSEENLTPGEELGKCWTISECMFAHINFQNIWWRTGSHLYMHFFNQYLLLKRLMQDANLIWWWPRSG